MNWSSCDGSVKETSVAFVFPWRASALVLTKRNIKVFNFYIVYSLSTLTVDATGDMFERNDNLKKRLSYPFIFSLVASWCIWNWEIGKWLLSHDSKEIENFFPSVWEYIKPRTTWQLLLLPPLISAIIYTLVCPPIIKAGITLFNSEVVRIKKARNLQVLDKEIKKYLKQKNSLQKR